MEKKFTQGPWRVKYSNSNHVAVIHVNDYSFAEVYYNSAAENEKGDYEAEYHANTKIIAAAPDMLEALNDLVEHIVFVLPFGKQDINKILAAKQVIKKATE